ncbi:cobaltochelatase subunit CobT [Alphaproteobacteria bacterium]|nr:cobaltochelatase subunit CobT [Alphaproteobacteria bacterium]
MYSKEKPVSLFKKAIKCSIKAISKDSDIEVIFNSADNSLKQSKTVNLPLPNHDLPEEDIKNIRGLGDSFALKKKYHNSEIHQKMRPNINDGQEIYDAIEKVRFESLGAKSFKGIALNLQATLDKHYKDLNSAYENENIDFPIEEAISIALREEISEYDQPKSSKVIVEKWNKLFDSSIKKTLKELSKNIDNQKLFSKLSKKLLEELDYKDSNNEEETSQNDPLDSDGQNIDDKNLNNEENANEHEDEHDNIEEKSSTAEDDNRSEKIETEISDDIEGNKDLENIENTQQNKFFDLNSSYKSYTSEFDLIELPLDLCDSDELLRLRKQLDIQLDKIKPTIGKLANKLQRKLLAKQNRSWNFDLEEGLLDAGRLARVVVDPTNSLSYKKEKDINFRDTVVTLLIDNSGSMRGRPITVAAMCGDILARTLERCRVNVEILGFTTAAWKGGKTREKWIDDGKPAKPGRLNDLRHIIFKSADQPWRRSRQNLGLMLREGLLKENIDGEALIWAHQRLYNRNEKRKILMVISDGAPVDDSTLSVNAGNYLDQHLHKVIQKIEEKSPVELVAIGIGHDVTRYYKRAVTIIDAEQLGGIMIEKLTELFNV